MASAQLEQGDEIWIDLPAIKATFIGFTKDFEVLVYRDTLGKMHTLSKDEFETVRFAS